MENYCNKKEVIMASSLDLCTKNLQVVSFDSHWKEVYLGSVHGDTFSALCPHSQLTVTPTQKLEVTYRTRSTATASLTCAKWCPMESCTVLVLGCQFGIKLFDWDGSTQIMEFDFHEQGIGIAAIGPHYIAAGLHTGTIVLFEVVTDDRNFVCRVVDSQRLHAAPTTDLASTTIQEDNGIKDVLVSADETGYMNVWYLGSGGDGLVHDMKIDYWTKQDTVTTLSLWNKTKSGIIIAGFSSGSIRLLCLKTGQLLSEVSAHLGWITGMDLASTVGLLVTAAEDGYIRVWSLGESGRHIEYQQNKAIPNALITGVKFLDPKGASFAVASYDTAKVQIFY